MSTTLDPMSEALKKRGQTPRTMVGGVPTMWECAGCGETVDAMLAFVHPGPGTVKLYHRPAPGAECGPLLTPTESRNLSSAEKETKRGHLLPDPKRAAEPAAHVCGHCGEMLPRRRYKSGRLEKRAVWLARKFCDRSCGMKARQKQHWGHANQKNPVRKGVERKRACLVCGDQLVRKRRPSGSLETALEFKKRVTCSRTCGQKWSWANRNRKKRGS